MIENARAFIITFIGPTNSRGARVKIKDLRHNKTKILSYSYEFNNCKDEAEVYLRSLNIPLLYAAETEKGYLILTDNFDIMIK